MSHRTMLRLVSSLTVVCATLLHAQRNPADPQRAALKKACDTGALSPEECRQKLAGLNAAEQMQAGTQGATATEPTTEPTEGGFGEGAQEYHDPRGRYIVTIPAGWQVKADDDGMSISRGDAWAMFTTSTNAAQPMDVDRAVAGQMQPQYTRFNVLNQGSYQTHLHHPAAGMTIETVKNGKPAVMLVMTQGAGSGHYLTMICSARARAVGSMAN